MASSVEGFGTIAERQTGWTHQECHQASEDAVRRAQIGRALPGAIHNQQLVLKKKRLRN